MKCSKCHTPVEFRHGGIEFVNLSRGYPQYAADTRMIYICKGCDGGGYWVDFPGLVRDGLDTPNGWLTHIRRKVWYNPAMGLELAEAYHFACALKSDNPPPMRSVVDSIPRRRPRTPPNPRAISVTLRARVFERDGFRCRRCGCGPSIARLVVDHVTPVAAGGTADFDNLQTLCEPCNAGKSDRAPTAHDTVRA